MCVTKWVVVAVVLLLCVATHGMSMTTPWEPLRNAVFPLPGGGATYSACDGEGEVFVCVDMVQEKVYAWVPSPHFDYVNNRTWTLLEATADIPTPPPPPPMVKRMPTMPPMTPPRFGASVATDGVTVVVGVPGFNQSQGAVSVFQLNATTLRETQLLHNPTVGDMQEFGLSVAVSGGWALLGGKCPRAYFYAFDRSTGLFPSNGTQTVMIPGKPPSFLIGHRVALRGVRAIIAGEDGMNDGFDLYSVRYGVGSAPGGAPGARRWLPSDISLVVRNASDPHTPVDKPSYGNTLALDRDYLLVGQPDDREGKGSVHVWRRNGQFNKWTYERQVNRNGTGSMLFSFGMALAANRALAVVGGSGLPASEAYELPKPNPVTMGLPEFKFSFSDQLQLDNVSLPVAGMVNFTTSVMLGRFAAVTVLNVTNAPVSVFEQPSILVNCSTTGSIAFDFRCSNDGVYATDRDFDCSDVDDVDGNGGVVFPGEAYVGGDFRCDRPLQLPLNDGLRVDGAAFFGNNLTLILTEPPGSSRRRRSSVTVIEYDSLGSEFSAIEASASYADAECEDFDVEATYGTTSLLISVSESPSCSSSTVTASPTVGTPSPTVTPTTLSPSGTSAPTPTTTTTSAPTPTTTTPAPSGVTASPTSGGEDSSKGGVPVVVVGACVGGALVLIIVTIIIATVLHKRRTEAINRKLSAGMKAREMRTMSGKRR